VDGSLIHGLHEQFVNVHVRGAAGDPDEDVGNVFGGERVGSFVNLLGPGNVAFEADD
jgi:hypothetical protein